MRPVRIKIKYTPSFLKSLRKFPQGQLKFLKQKEEIFLKNPFDRRLKTHKLKGELDEQYSFSVSYHWRIVFHFEGDNTVMFDAIGTHEIYH